MSEATSTMGGTSAKGWFSLTSAALTAVVVGFASTILLIMEAADAVGASPAEKASWAAALCIGQAITTLILSWRYKMPIITAWSGSTPVNPARWTRPAGSGLRPRDVSPPITWVNNARQPIASTMRSVGAWGLLVSTVSGNHFANVDSASSVPG